MAGINQFIKENLSTAARVEKRCYVSPNIPAKQLDAAVKAFEYEGDPGSILGIIDTSMMGSAKAGYLFTGERFIRSDLGVDAFSVRYEDLLSARVETTETTDKKGKIKTKQQIVIATRDSGDIRLNPSHEVDLEGLAKLISSIAESFDEFSEQSQLQPIDELDEELKLAYLKVIVNMAFDNDGSVDDKEFTEILQLISRLKVSSEARMSLRHYMTNPDAAMSNEELIGVIDAHAPDGMLQSLHISLIKDLISVHSALNGVVSGDFAFVKQVRPVLQCGDSEVELAVQAIENDKKILDRSYTDNAIQKSVKELSAKAVAVGVPLGAVYLSGSVVGMSAAGMTSGLATLGFGGVLGLSSMATGIGAAIILGVVAYKGVQFLSNTGVEEGDKRREIMLQEVIRQGQKTMQIIIEDINNIATQLSEALKSQDKQNDLVNKLEEMLLTYAKSASHINNQNQQAEADKQRLKSPEVLDKARLEACTGSQANRKHREFILNFYEEGVVIDRNKQDEEVEKVVLKLIPSASDEEMEKLGEVFAAIGYASAGSALKGKFRKAIS